MESVCSQEYSGSEEREDSCKVEIWEGREEKMLGTIKEGLEGLFGFRALQVHAECCTAF